MGPTGQKILAIVEMAYWTPATALAGYVTFKHGFGRQLGWILILILGIVRLVGSSCQVAFEEQSNSDTGLAIAAAVCNSIGLSFLIACFHPGHARSSQYTPSDTLAGADDQSCQRHLGIAGGSDMASYDDPDKVSSGRTYMKASIILALIVFLAVGLAIAFTLVYMQHVQAGEGRLVYASLVAYPFLAVRMLYSLIVIFANTGTFNLYHSNIVVKALMQVLMEFVVAAIVISAGIVVQRMAESASRDDEQGEEPFAEQHGERT